VLWVSETAVYNASKPVRGGVPVCWPWFGPYDPATMGADPTDAAKRAHGFARYEIWEVEAVGSLPDGATQVVLSLGPNPSMAKAWPHDFKLRLAVSARHRRGPERSAGAKPKFSLLESSVNRCYFRAF